MEVTYLLAGGDRRQFWLSCFLARCGRVYTVAVPGVEDCLPDRAADVLILPTPCLNQRGRICCAEPKAELELEALRGLYDVHTRVYGGALPPDLEERLPGCGSVRDLLQDPLVGAVNGRLTAEAAAALAMEHTEGSLFGTNCLVLGWGKVGKPLSALLKALQARVIVAARRPEVRAEAAQLGYELREFETPGTAPELIFNTVPAQTLSRAELDTLAADCLWVELASAPGGLPAGIKPRFSLLPANALPGRRLPKSAAAALLGGILRNEVCV